MAATVGDTGDIYMIFNKDDLKHIKSIGTLSAELNDTSIGSISDVNKLDEPEVKIIQEKLFNSIKKSTPIKPNDSVIVKLQNSIPDNFLYIPGVVTVAGATYTINIGEGTTITNVDARNITKNRQLKDNETGWFFSDSVLASFIKDGKVNVTSMPYNEYADKIDAIRAKSDTYRLIENKKATTVGTDVVYEINTIDLGSKDITEVKAKSVVPYFYNQKADLQDKIEQIDTAIVFGGKKSKKPKTRKNTMPLQYAPGAKRAYLKRRKSSRK